MRKELMIVIFLILVVLVVAGHFLFFYRIDCLNEECFSKAIINCDRATFVRDTNETINYYTIQGSGNEGCEINVKLLQIKKGTAELSVLEGQEMTCYTPKNTLVLPETDLNNCHGLLKEAIQELVIQRMHKQIVENLGQINQDINKII